MTETPWLAVAGLDGLWQPPLAFTVAARECLAVCGASGTGKTRLLRMIADLEPHAGEVRLRGTPSTALPPARWRRQVMLVPAETAWWGDRVGEHFLAPPPEEAMARLGFAPAVLDWPVARLSSGERQRLGLLRALVLRPAVLLLDEPTANLDADNTAAVEALVAGYLAQRPAAALWVSHDEAQRRRLARRTLHLLEDGRWRLEQRA